MWQSHVEIKGYSVVHFDYITVFEEPYHIYIISEQGMTSFTHSHIPSQYKRILINSVLEEPWNKDSDNLIPRPAPSRGRGEGAEEEARAVKNNEA